MAKKKTDTTTIELQRLQDAFIDIPIVGLTPVIPHNWSDKAKRMMPGHPDAAGKVKKLKEPREPEKEAEGCQYFLNGDYALPGKAFKVAIISACRFFSEPTMVEAKSLIGLVGEGPDDYVPFTYEKKELREDPVRNANGGADLRYRYYFIGWRAVLRVRYVADRISKASVIALVDAAGRVGICDWRPSSPKVMSGTYGTWKVDDTQEWNSWVAGETPPPKSSTATRKVKMPLKAK